MARIPYATPAQYEELMRGIRLPEDTARTKDMLQLSGWLCAVRWYLRYSLSLRDVEELPEEHGLHVDHTTVAQRNRGARRCGPMRTDQGKESNAPCAERTGFLSSW
jgi:hypothetical protein